MSIDDIREHIRSGRYYESRHARNERQNDNLGLEHIEAALLSGEILESYPDTGRGESCLVVGFSGPTPIHAVCGWTGPDQRGIVLITVYIPKPPKFVDPKTRASR